jgi:peptidoglycan/LPS O-acetylase OafA/YrhL
MGRVPRIKASAMSALIPTSAAVGGLVAPADVVARGSRRILDIDVLRGVSALLVVFYHYTTRDLPVDVHHSQNVLFGVPWGSIGVQFFFVISGFVIFMTIERCRQPRDFIVSRLSRLFPTFWIAVTFSFIVVRATHLDSLEVSFSDYLLNLTMVPALFGAKLVDNVYWTLFEEMKFYVFIGVVYFSFLRRYLSYLCLVWIGLTLVLALLKHGMPDDVFDLASEATIYFNAHCFVAGMAIYILRKKFDLHWFLILALCVAIACLRQGWPFNGILVLFIGCLWLLVTRKTAALAWPPLIFIGEISYALYLVHQYPGYALIHFGYSLGINPNISIVIAILLSIGVATILTFCIERPAIRWIRRMAGRTARG